MPARALRVCHGAGCAKTTTGRYCDTCQEKSDRSDQIRDRARGSAASRGYSSPWRKYARAFLAKHPLCVCEECTLSEHPKLATVVDHIEPHRGDKKKFWQHTNHQPMAKVCHDKKTAREDGRWGKRTTK